jgi:dTDP-4-amino-4,6-dideoxygalactose transaminase
MDPELLEQAIIDGLKTGKKPKAILVVHLYGMPAKIDEILKISEKYQIPLIEDAAEALGSKYSMKSCGTFGEMGILSFNGNKIITTSGGGSLISNNENFIKRAKFYATQSRDNAAFYQHSSIGYNYRLSNVLAGIGRGQLSVIEQRVAKRRSIFDFYNKELESTEAITFLKEKDNYFSNRWLTTILLNSNSGVTPDDLRLFLETDNIESRPLWKPMHLQPIFHDCPNYVNGTSEKLFEHGLCLPSGSNMNESDMERVVSQIKKYFNQKSKKHL